jgi:hypothetical protein
VTSVTGFVDDVRAGMAERESELRTALGVDTDDADDTAEGA